MPPVASPHLAPPVGGCAPNGGISASTSTASLQFPVASDCQPRCGIGRSSNPADDLGVRRRAFSRYAATALRGHLLLHRSGLLQLLQANGGRPADRPPRRNSAVSRI